MEFSSKPIRVFFCGAHSTGKTTLLNDVCKIVDIHPVAEVARQVIREKFTKDDLDWRNHPQRFEKVQLEILRKQSEVEELKHAQGQGRYGNDLYSPFS